LSVTVPPGRASTQKTTVRPFPFFSSSTPGPRHGQVSGYLSWPRSSGPRFIGQFFFPPLRFFRPLDKPLLGLPQIRLPPPQRRSVCEAKSKVSDSLKNFSLSCLFVPLPGRRSSQLPSSSPSVASTSDFGFPGSRIPSPILWTPGVDRPRPLLSSYTSVSFLVAG